jgi:hypothetical protein
MIGSSQSETRANFAAKEGRNSPAHKLFDAMPEQAPLGIGIAFTHSRWALNTMPRLQILH